MCVDRMAMYVVWVGGVEVNDYYVTKERAEEIAEYYRKDGYDDVVISQSFMK